MKTCWLLMAMTLFHSRPGGRARAGRTAALRARLGPSPRGRSPSAGRLRGSDRLAGGLRKRPGQPRANSRAADLGPLRGQADLPGHRPLPGVRIQPPQPLPIKQPFDAVSLWIYGNNWGWAPDPKTPPVTVQALLRRRRGQGVPGEPGTGGLERVVAAPPPAGT